MCATLIGCAVEMPDSQLASYLQRKSVDDNVAAWSLTHLRDVQSRPISSVADAGNDSDDSVLNEEEERLLDRLMASQLAQRWCPLRDLGLVSLHRLRRAPPAAHRGVALGACVCMVLTKEAEGSVGLSWRAKKACSLDEKGTKINSTNASSPSGPKVYPHRRSQDLRACPSTRTSTEGNGAPGKFRIEQKLTVLLRAF